ncbi:hypothetical protein GLAREA_06764 [Glarea lozoyensis ATCC 20868]|uniref:RNI-like protein n=1 Tax=Glarea lozoyensis (strain ATCC 20868 / MF5171) TaxID=1116229 RepID=S3DNT2_GLAL2|nr:uncharacterized protein GLAREA_06764 [Glarea lozoyensis ATCC 20868]EPE33751.1 hypothetical protein GLAREA_06764 [Glarea lozoyensis ATCC 20868]
MASNLESVATELAIIIGDCLDVNSICSLRLASHSTARLFTPSLRPFVKGLHADLTEFTLSRLCDLAFNTELGSAVRILRLDCVYFRTFDEPWVYNMGGKDVPWTEDQEPEQQQFAGQPMCKMLTKVLNGFPNVREIILAACVATYDDERHVDLFAFKWTKDWLRAFAAYQALLSAIINSGTQLDSLVVYQKLKKCSIPTHAITIGLLPILHTTGFKAFGMKLKAFSLDLAMTTQPPRPNETSLSISNEEDVQLMLNHGASTKNYRGGSEIDIEGVSLLLRLMPNLESLEINLYPAASLDEEAYGAFLPTLFKDNWKLPRLKKLTFLGLTTTHEALQGVLTRHAATLEEVSFDHVNLSSGSWNQVFETLSQRMPLLSTLHLSLIATTSDPMEMNLEPADRRLDPIEKPEPHRVWNMETEDYENCWVRRTIDRDEIKRGLRFRPLQVPPSAPVLSLCHNFYTLDCSCCD